MNKKDFLNKVMPFKDKVYRLAKRLLVSGDEADDATQELYFKLWKNREKIETYDNVEAYAMRMTKNYCLDQLKSKRAGNLRLIHRNYKDETIKPFITKEVKEEKFSKQKAKKDKKLD